MQKDGSYSEVPRIPGGEITPEKLLVIGQVAKKYGLYTKITGGQRIDLFGAQVNQLPAIWGELIASGFESGHAYGKSLRTVKSCVGSTWCRYGVQDSVGFAIELENRYKGLRSPHNLKFAVSGCTRECAEAQSKDVGVIATEKGWNLYVCGNGGMKPRHADLLASDLDRDTLIRPSVGTITRKGFDNNVEVCVRYLAAWLDGQGCVPIHWLMEDAATAEIGRAQLWTWLHHGQLHLDDGTPVDCSLFDRALMTLPSKLADRMKLPGGSKINEAIALLDQLTHADELAEFLTLPAYERLG